DWKEGGPLSASREYLRVTRQGLVFDICGAPFGTGFFVSLWYGRKPLRLGALSIVCGVATLLALLGLFFMPWAMTLFFLAVALVCFLVIVARVGSNLDDFLLNVPGISYFYIRYFRTITLYRVDLACMYLAAVHASVVQVIDEISNTQGVKPLS